MFPGFAVGQVVHTIINVKGNKGCILMEEELRRLKEENEKLHKIIKIYDTAKQDEIQCKMNRICSALKVEWLDFQDALNMEMNPVLAENLKDQIKSIFKILKKEGIDVESYTNKK